MSPGAQMCQMCLQVISPPPAFFTGLSWTGNRTLPRTDAHRSADATFSNSGPDATQRERCTPRCVVPHAAPPSCSAASCPASDSCAPPLRSSPASSTRRPRCATSTRLSNSSIPHRQVNYAAAPPMVPILTSEVSP